MSSIQGRMMDLKSPFNAPVNGKNSAVFECNGAAVKKKKRTAVAVEAEEVLEDSVCAQNAITTCDMDVPLSFTEDRHLCPIEGQTGCVTQTWRMKERMKTVSVALVLCLNVGVDPPDVVKTQPCARLECWIDPLSLSPPKALEKIGQNLQTQYERWQPRARYKQSLDPTAEEVRKLCTSLRRNAKEERVLFHYNGHGVPKPTTNGEIWVFNRTYTQYIPLSIFDLQTWMGAPSIYVYDCSNAGIIVESFKQFAQQHETENELKKMQQTRGSGGAGGGASPNNSGVGGAQAQTMPSFKNCIQLAACSDKQVLPMNPDLPADLFTSCLTTPIKVALKWYILQPTAKLVPRVTMDMIDNIPGQISDRRTMLGELNWIFTAITDTIAWNTLPRDLFQKLFRQDLLVASLFRNFLLAERIMKSCDCTPVSSPSLPPTFQHHMWAAWDYALDISLGQLPDILQHNKPFRHLTFFEEQLTAFQVWLELGSEQRKPPEQLPIVLQVLLSQVHRTRALELLGKFLDLGPWAVNLALSVGIFPYVLKLLQSCAKELRPLLVFIWAKILAVDNTCQADLVRDNGHRYFLQILQDTTLSAESRTQATFVLACIVHNYRDGQEAALQGNLVSNCLEQLNDSYSPLRQWVAICLGRLWDHYEEARWTGVRDIAHEKLYNLLKDPVPEVRAAAVYALGTFINSVNERSEHANTIDHSVVMNLVKLVMNDMSALVRKELVCALQCFVLAFQQVFVKVAMREGSILQPIHDLTSSPGLKRIGSRDRLRVNEDYSFERMKRVSSSSSINTLGGGKMATNLSTLPSLGYGSVYMKIWMALTMLETDPHPEVASMSAAIINHVRAQIREEVRESNKVDTSASLPPSPNRSNYLSNVAGSPPTSGYNTSDLSASIDGSTSTPPIARQRKHSHQHQRRKSSSLRMTDSDDGAALRKSLLVDTNFVAWSSKRFSQRLLTKEGATNVDCHSTEYYERDWRFIRNEKIRTEGAEERLLAEQTDQLVHTFQSRTAHPPSILQLHPFDQKIAVASRDIFGIWDWGTGAKTTVYQSRTSKPSNMSSGAITALEWVNSHDVSLLMVGANDGSIKVYKMSSSGGSATTSGRDPALISAWQAFDEPRPPPGGVLLAWEQWTQHSICAGDSKVIRLWDARRELRTLDLPTGTDSNVTCLDSTFAALCHDTHALYLNEYNPSVVGANNFDSDSDGFSNKSNPGRLGLVAVGCQDGSVRVFDRRCAPTEARIHTFMEHRAQVQGVQLRGNLLISGSSDGEVRIYDLRQSEAMRVTNAIPQGATMSCLSIHRTANLYACGSPNQFVNIYKLNGQFVTSIRFYEGFMGHRIGPITCLNYHQHKVALATGTADNFINVYTLDANRR